MFKLVQGLEFSYIKTCIRNTEFLADANGRLLRRFVQICQTGQLNGWAIGDNGD